jgi:hypothetical protein
MLFIFAIAVLNLAFGFALALYLGGHLGVPRQIRLKKAFSVNMKSWLPKKRAKLSSSAEMGASPAVPQKPAT